MKPQRMKQTDESLISLSAVLLFFFFFYLITDSQRVFPLVGKRLLKVQCIISGDVNHVRFTCYNNNKNMHIQKVFISVGSGTLARNEDSSYFRNKLSTWINMASI